MSVNSWNNTAGAWAGAERNPKCQGSKSGTHLGLIADKARSLRDELDSGRARELVKEGVWVVPPQERFKGWEKLGVREK